MAEDNLPVLRQQTKEFIAANDTEVILNRITTESDGAGGLKKILTPLPAQSMRLIKRNTSTAVFRRTIDGQEVQPDFVLLGEYDADVETGDWFFISGRKYEIVYKQDDQRYETWAEVIYRG